VTSAARAALGGDAGSQWLVGHEIIFENDPEQVMFYSRLPFALLATLLGVLIYAWGRQMLGGAAALGALFLYALDPTILAHASLVTTDVGLASFSVLFLYSLWLYLKQRNLSRLLCCGLALGAALGSKFSGLFLLPIAAILVISAAHWVPAASPALRSSFSDPYASGARASRVFWCLGALLAMSLVAALVVESLYLFGHPSLYLKGIQLVNQDHRPNFSYFMDGDFGRRFLSYYIVAYLLKEPVASLVLVLIGLGALARRAAATSMDRLFLLLPPVVFLAAYTWFSDNLGIRYIIPALPLLYLVGGAGLALLLRKGLIWGRALVAGLCVWLVVAAVGIYPDHLSYFNELACLLKDPSRIGWDGGAACGPLWLDDSNVDWGQGLKQLRSWLDQHAKGRKVRLAYFGTFPPENYGLAYERIEFAELMRPPAAGLHVLSSHMVARAAALLTKEYLDGPRNWLLQTPPTAVIGHAYYVYDVPPASYTLAR